MKLIIKNEYSFLIFLFIVSLLTRLIISPFYISPDVPHDFYAYINAGEAIIRGDIYSVVTADKISYQYVGPYGPLIGLTYAPLLLIFGKNFFILKLPAIIFNSFDVILIYYIVKNLKNISYARHAAIIFSFSHLVLLSSATSAVNDNYELFWVLGAIYFLTKKVPNFKLSAISLGIGLGYIFFTPSAVLLPIIYYFYRINDVKNGLKYIALTLLTLSMILLPFYIKFGFNVLYPYVGTWMHVSNWPAPIISEAGMTLPHLIKMLGYYFFFGIDKPYDEYYLPRIVPLISGLVGFSIYAIYLIKFKLEDKKIELMRNIFLIFFIGLFFMVESHYYQLIWMFPFILIMVTYGKDSNETEFDLSLWEIIGFALLIIGITIYSIFYREFIVYPNIEKLILILTIVVATAGTYVSLLRTDIRNSWSMITFAGSFYIIMDARPMTLLGAYINEFQLTRISWGVHYFSSIVFMLLAMVVLLKNIHTITQLKNKS